MREQVLQGTLRPNDLRNVVDRGGHTSSDLPLHRTLDENRQPLARIAVHTRIAVCPSYIHHRWSPASRPRLASRASRLRLPPTLPRESCRPTLPSKRPQRRASAASLTYLKAQWRATSVSIVLAASSRVMVLNTSSNDVGTCNCEQLPSTSSGSSVSGLFKPYRVAIAAGPRHQALAHVGQPQAAVGCQQQLFNVLGR